MKLEELSKFLKSVTKIYPTEYSADKIKITYILTMDVNTDRPTVLCKSIEIDYSSEIEQYLKSSEVESLIYAPKERGILLIDVVEYSKYDTLGQAAIISIFKQSLNSALLRLKMFSEIKAIEQIIPTGDGCYVVFSEQINDRFLWAVPAVKLEMYCLQGLWLKKSNQKDTGARIKIRMACELGEVDFFIDSAENRNCYGIGMNETERILCCGKKEVGEKYPNQVTEDTVFIGEKVLGQASNIMNYLNSISSSPEVKIIDLGELFDKHKEKRRVWWIIGLPKNVAATFHSIFGDKAIQPIFYKL